MIAATVLAIVALAVVQQQWIRQLSENERGRLRSRLNASVEIFRRSFSYELEQVAITPWRRLPESSGAAIDTSSLAAPRWIDIEGHGDLIRAIYFGRPDGRGGVTVDRFHLDSGDFERVITPPHIQAALLDCGILDAAESAQVGSRRRIFAVTHLADDRPLLMRSVRGGRPGSQPSTEFGDYLIVEMNATYFRTTLLPELIGRSFGAAGLATYDVGIVRSAGSSELLYRSRSVIDAAVFASADVRVPVLLESDETAASSTPAPGGAALTRDALFRDSVARCGAPRSAWELVVRHRMGSVDHAVANLRNRNLAISGGIIVLLTVSVVMMFTSTRRAQRLARVQMAIAAGVSHEVRSPLSVIRSAADNLADGAVTETERVKEYGALIRREGKRLTELVEAALRFASMHGGSAKLRLDSIAVGPIVEATVSQLAPAIQKAGVRIETLIEPELPPVMADPGALDQCVQNLIANALKYGSNGGWMGIQVRNSKEPGNLPVLISVVDKGPGIRAEDVRFIFEPFFQGMPGDKAKPEGFGLGLSLTKEIMEAMGGKVTVETEMNKGSRFTLHLRRAVTDGRQSPSD